VSAVLTYYVADLLFSRSPRVELFEGYDLAACVLAPAGAMLIAASAGNTPAQPLGEQPGQ
jgi:hypothetical protein